VGGRLAPLPGVSGASVRGVQNGRYQSVIQEEGEGFAHSHVDESNRIRYYHPHRNCDILSANGTSTSPERFSRLELLVKRFAQEHFSQLPPSLRVVSYLRALANITY